LGIFLLRRIKMDQKAIAKKMIEFNKAAIDNGLKAISMCQDQNEKITDMFLEKAIWLPEKRKKDIKDWMMLYKTVYENFVSLVNENIEKMDTYLSELQ
jgi:hypothetical protein